MALCLVFAGSAFANFGPHGGYVNDTDACAGCHRAHTSFSTVGWKDGLGTEHASALLVGNATTMTEFCDACHGDTAPGASTNVQSGIFDSGPSAGSPDTAPGGSSTLAAAPGGYPGDGGSAVLQVNTASTFGAPLNGGGFDRMPDPYAWQGTANGGTGPGGVITFVASTSAHKMDVDGPLWGSGATVSSFGGTQGLTCTDCHDPHGSSNYRLLKAKPNPAGPVVGGYQADNVTPNPFVFSNEVGYPVPAAVFNTGNPGGGVAVPGYPAGGWLKHADGAAQVAAYRPNYTNTTGTDLLHTNVTPQTQSISVWCAACHTGYNVASAGTGVVRDYGGYLPLTSTGQTTVGGPGSATFHSHAVDIDMGAGLGATRALAEQVVQDSSWVPLENPGSGTNDFAHSYIGCETCHRAHATSVSMGGWAASHLVKNTTTNVYMPVKDSVPGVDPDKGSYGTPIVNGQGSSALLRANNRGVCERCHDK